MASKDKNLLSNGDPRPDGLYAKIAYVMGQVQHVPKNGVNTFHNYRYTREVDLTEHLRPLMAELGLVVLPCATSDLRIIESPDGKVSSRVTLVYYEFKFVDADTGEAVVVPVWGGGQDGQDKGPYKALTGAMKYALMKTFMVPTGDDPEATDGEGSSTAQPARRSEPKPEPPKPAARKRPSKKAPSKPDDSDDADELLERQIAEMRAAVAAACETFDTMVQEGTEFAENELANKDAAVQLVATDMEDRPRYLKALTRAQEYVEKLIAAYAEAEDGEEEE